METINEGIVEEMRRHGLKVTVSGREKHPYSIWRKMQERHVAFDQLSDINAFRIITENPEDCYWALGVLHRKWQMVPGRFKDFISTPKRNGYRSIHTTILFARNMRVEVQIRSKSMHAASEFGFAAHWAYKQEDKPDGQAGWIRDLIEIMETSHDAEDLLENARMAMYHDRIFAFTPKGALHQLPKGATAVDFAYAVHTDLGDKTVGAKVNGRHVPLRTPLGNGDMVEILKSKAQEPQPGWLNFVVTGKARAAICRHVRVQQRDELIAIGRELYNEVVQRAPIKIGKKALAAATDRLGFVDADELMHAVGAGKMNDQQLIAALLPGYESNDSQMVWASQENAISIRGLTPGMGYHLGDCCHPVPGDRIIGMRIPDQPVEVHTIECGRLASDADVDWVDLSWGEGSDGAAARLRVVIHNRPGTLGEIASLFGYQKANIINLRMSARDEEFHTFEIDLEVHDLHHLLRIISALRASESVATADRVYG